jgi:hypothetical protein
MLIGKKPDIIASEIAPREVFEHRREFIKTAGTGLVAGAAATWGLLPGLAQATAVQHNVSFGAGERGLWKIDQIDSVVGETLSPAACLEVIEGHDTLGNQTKAWAWVLGGTTSNTRYTTQQEADAMSAIQEGLGRPAATRAALIPIRKTEAWWSLAQDERRAIFEEQSHHIAIGMEYLPAVARRLYHSRELGEPFDFLTWFEYAPEDSAAFERLVDRLRKTPEWRYVDREVDIRLTRT